MNEAFHSVRIDARAVRLLAALAAMAASTSAASTPAAAEAPQSGTIEAPMASVVNYMRETCIDFTPGKHLEYAFEAPYPVDFNIHRHLETTTEFPVKLRVEGPHRGDVALPHGGEYCFTWTNPAAQPEDYVIRLQYEAR